jgi:small subunit ribosomal protein S6
MRKYEIMYIVNASLEDAARTNVVESVHKTLTDNGATIDKVDEWGSKEFAYEINHMTKGFYYVINVTAGNEAIDEFNRLTRINSNVIRFLVIKTDEEK